MDRKELNEKWAGYCQNFVGEKPEGFSVENAVFNAQKKDFSEESLKKLSEKDWLESVSFCNEKTMPLLGSMQVNREEIRDLIDFLKQNKVKMAFGYEVGVSDPFHVVKDGADLAGRDVWFIGDIHGDILAFRSALAFINSNSRQKPIYVLLGDIFDRNDFSLNVVLEVLRLFKNNPDSVFMIAGNHDDGLSWNENGQRFSSTVTPQQYTDYLNAVNDDLINSLMEEFVKVIKDLPLGLVLPNGLLVAHGGVPSRPDRSVKNIWEGLTPQEIKKLIAEKRSDFQRNRFMGEVSSGSKLSPEFSWVELINFSHAVESAYGVTIRSLLRGHDHCDLYRHEWSRSSFKGNENCPDYERVQNVLTMTSMTLMDEGEKKISGFLKRNVSCPSVAHYVAEALVPKVYSLELPAEEVMKYSTEMRKYLGKESLEMVEKHLDRLEEDLRELEDDLSENEEKIAKAMPAYEEQEKKVENLKSVFHAAENECKDVTAKLENVSQKLMQSETTKLEKVSCRDKLRENVGDTEEQLEKTRIKIDECNAILEKINANQKDKSLIEKGIASIKKLIGKEQEKKKYSPKVLKEKVDKLMVETERQQKKKDDDEKNAQVLQEEINKIDADILTLKQDRERLEQEKPEKNAQLENARKMVQEATQKLNELQRDKESCERRINQARSDATTVKQGINLCISKRDLYASWCASQNG